MGAGEVSREGGPPGQGSIDARGPAPSAHGHRLQHHLTKQCFGGFTPFLMFIGIFFGLLKYRNSLEGTLEDKTKVPLNERGEVLLGQGWGSPLPTPTLAWAGQGHLGQADSSGLGDGRLHCMRVKGANAHQVLSKVPTRKAPHTLSAFPTGLFGAQPPTHSLVSFFSSTVNLCRLILKPVRLPTYQASCSLLVVSLSRRNRCHPWSWSVCVSC